MQFVEIYEKYYQLVEYIGYNALAREVINYFSTDDILAFMESVDTDYETHLFD